MIFSFFSLSSSYLRHVQCALAFGWERLLGWKYFRNPSCDGQQWKLSFIFPAYPTPKYHNNSPNLFGIKIDARFSSTEHMRRWEVTLMSLFLCAGRKERREGGGGATPETPTPRARWRFHVIRTKNEPDHCSLGGRVEKGKIRGIQGWHGWGWQSQKMAPCPNQ